MEQNLVNLPKHTKLMQKLGIEYIESNDISFLLRNDKSLSKNISYELVNKAIAFHNLAQDEYIKKKTAALLLDVLELTKKNDKVIFYNHLLKTLVFLGSLLYLIVMSYIFPVFIPVMLLVSLDLLASIALLVLVSGLLLVIPVLLLNYYENNWSDKAWKELSKSAKLTSIIIFALTVVTTLPALLTLGAAFCLSFTLHIVWGICFPFLVFFDTKKPDSLSKQLDKKIDELEKFTEQYTYIGLTH